MFEFKESSFSLSGEINIKLIDKNTNEILLEDKQKNLIVENGKYIVANLLIGNFTNYEITQIGFGDSTTAATSADIDLQGTNKNKSAVITANSEVSGNNVAKIYWEIDYDTDIVGQDMGGTNPWIDGNPFTIREFGLFTVNNTLFNRLIWAGADLVMDSGIKLEGHFQITVG